MNYFPPRDDLCCLSPLLRYCARLGRAHAAALSVAHGSGPPYGAPRTWPPRISALGPCVAHVCSPSDARHPRLQLVELKNGETYNGELVACDNWMNIRSGPRAPINRHPAALLLARWSSSLPVARSKPALIPCLSSSLPLDVRVLPASLRGVICTSRDGDRFWRLPEVTIRGNNIKYLRIPEEVIDMVPAEEDLGASGGRGRGRGGDGRGRGGGKGKGDGKGGKGGRGGGGGRGDGKGAGRAAGRGGRY